MTKERVGGRTLVVSTSNGTRAMLAGVGADTLLVGAFVNLAATAERALAHDGDVVLVCAGRDGAVAADDVAFAGALARRITAERAFDVDDATRVALSHAPATTSNADVLERLAQSGPGKRLAELGFDRDVAHAALVDHVDAAVLGRVQGAAVRLTAAAPVKSSR
jgi:2-phosphosulfolactate phosphatase